MDRINDNLHHDYQTHIRRERGEVRDLDNLKKLAAKISKICRRNGRLAFPKNSQKRLPLSLQLITAQNAAGDANNKDTYVFETLSSNFARNAGETKHLHALVRSHFLLRGSEVAWFSRDFRVECLRD